MNKFAITSALADRFESCYLSKYSMDVPEVLKGLRQILAHWLPEDKKNLTELLGKYEDEYEAAREAKARGELVEMNTAVMTQTHQNIRGVRSLFDYIPKFEKHIFNMYNEMKEFSLDSHDLYRYFTTKAAEIITDVNEESDYLKNRLGIYFNPRELKAFRKLSVIMRDHMTDMGKHPVLEPFPSRMRDVTSPGGMDPYQEKKQEDVQTGQYSPMQEIRLKNDAQPPNSKNHLWPRTEAPAESDQSISDEEPESDSEPILPRPNTITPTGFESPSAKYRESVNQ